ncbi:guanylate kinase [Steroidobacter denitrificans]|uniref:Guanylate kinase n=1 Tax=Steroidobacter denitrificans TaxID=465721 RepID=A0A127FEK4_STEDE|nr:guanylate kinase [Steroidobacter denitrificans]
MTVSPRCAGKESVKKLRGQLFVIAAPSGAGKTSLVRALMQHRPDLRFSISYTTRPQRPNEVDKRDYFFVDERTFEQMAATGKFLEHARVFDHHYGTSKAQVEALLEQGENVLLEIDWQGAQQIRRAMPTCHSIFILPPSREALEQRLRGRQSDSDEVIARRLRDSIGDMSHWAEFDAVVINDDFGQATSDLAAIVAGETRRFSRQRPELRPLLDRLLS